MAATRSGSVKPSVGHGKQEIEESLWDVNFDKADQRISARRNRIRNRIDAARKVKTMVQVGHMFGYHGATQLDTFPVQVSSNDFCSLIRAITYNLMVNPISIISHLTLNLFRSNVEKVECWLML